MIPPELIEFVANLSLKDLITYGAGGAALTKYGIEGMHYIKEKVKEKWALKQYGFTPNAEEAKRLHQIEEKDIYKRLVDCVGEHWALPLIRVGIYLSDINDSGRKELANKIRAGVQNRYDIKGLRVLELGSTRMIINVIQYVSDLKLLKNLTKEELSLELDKIIEHWAKSTIFVKLGDKISNLEVQCIRSMNNSTEPFFLFACGSAVKQAIKFIEHINKEDLLSKHNYNFNFTSKNPSGNLEILFGIFEQRENNNAE